MPPEIGTVICTPDGPSPSEFSFVVTANDRKIPVRRGQFVELETEEGKVVATVTDVIKTNRYFMRPESVGEYERRGKPLTSIFPADRWEYIVARAKAFGIQTENGIKQVSFPASPGQKVLEASPETLVNFLGLDEEDGVDLGKLRYHDLPAKLNLTKLLRKHVAILAMSGAGKCLSYEIPVFLANGELRPIGDLVDSAFERAQGKKSEDGVEYVDQNPEGLKVLTLGPKMRVESAHIDAFMRRKLNGKLLRIRTRSGKELRLTPEHPLLTIEGGRIRWKSAEKLRSKEKIAVPRQVKVYGELQEVNLAELFRSRSDVWAFGVKEKLDPIVKKLTSEGKTLKKLAEHLDVSYGGLRYRLKSGNIPLKQLNSIAELAGCLTAPEVELIGLKWSKPTRARITVDEDFARFLAYLFAGGRNNGKVLEFVNSVSKFLDDFANLSEKIIGIKPFTVKRQGHEHRIISSKSAAFIMENAFQIKRTAADKKIPRIILKSPDLVVQGYLRTLFDCDGYCGKHGTTVSIAFSNPINALRTEALLLRFGIISKIRKRIQRVGETKRSYWYLYIQGVGNLNRFAEHVGFKTVEKARCLREHLALKPNPNLDLVPEVGSIIKFLCKKLKISYEKLKRETGVNGISRYVAGWAPSRESLLKITKGLRDRLNELTKIRRRLSDKKLLVPRVDQTKALDAIRRFWLEEKIPYKGISSLFSVSASTVSRMLQGKTAVTDNVFDIAQGICENFDAQDHPDSMLLLTAGGATEDLKAEDPEETRDLASSFTRPCAGIDKCAGFSRGTIYEYLAGMRLFDLLGGLGRYVGSESELEDAEREITKLEELATSHIFWDEITSIEKSDPGNYVYDLCIRGSHNFIAGNTVVHNSYSSAVLIEELLDRLEERGRVASIVIDAHGEYVSLATPSKNADYSGRTTVIKGEDVRIGVPNLSAYQFREFIPDMSGSQVRELGRVLRELQNGMRSGGKAFGLGEVIARIEENSETHKQLRRALLDRLYDLRSLDVFGECDYPYWEKIVNPGKVVILDLNETLNLRKKQVIVAYIARKLFNLRKAGRSPPFVLFLEEAHQFAPSTDSAISSPIIRTIAREGRKFYASLVLISQRPVRLSTTVLSQANTNIILRITNPYDLDHIKQSSERITRETIEMISSLPVGEALVVGEAVNHPIFIRVRKRRSQEATYGASLEEIARKFERSRDRRRQDAKAFM